MQEVPDYDVEHSEVLLYHIHVLEDLGELTEALTLLDINAKSRAITDRVAIMEFRGKLFNPRTMHPSHYSGFSPAVVQAWPT